MQQLQIQLCHDDDDGVTESGSVYWRGLAAVAENGVKMNELLDSLSDF